MFLIGESPNLYLDGIRLNNVDESLCKDFKNIKNLDSIHVCSFVKFLNQSLVDESENDYVIFSLKDQNGTFLTLSFGANAFVVDNFGEKKVFLKKVDFQKYIKICLRKTDGDVELEINHSKAKTISEEDIQDENVNLSKKLKHFMKLIHYTDRPDFLPEWSPSENYVTFCIGQIWESKTMPLEMYGLEIRADKLETNDTNENLCINSINRESLLTFDSSEMWNFKSNSESMFAFNSSEKENLKSNKVIITNFETKNKFNKSVIPVVDACRDTYIIFFTDYAKSFEVAAKMCETLNGGLPSIDDVIFFRKYFDDIRKNLQNQLKRDASISMWITRHPKDDPSTLDSYCYYLNLSSIFEHTNFEEHLNNVPCFIKMKYNFCLIPAYSDFTYYGALLIYDRYYFLKSRENFLFLEGEGDSVIEWNQNKWILRSQIHKEYCELRSPLAVGRHFWNCTDENKENSSSLLTFTHCKKNEFACTEGKCLPRSSRCNGLVECSDKSDEENCQKINKKLGFSTEIAPPLWKNETIFEIDYTLRIKNSDDLTSEKGIAIIDIDIAMGWRDPRIEFFSNVVFRNCDEIWHPKLLMTDEGFDGFRVNYEAYRLVCMSQPFSSAVIKEFPFTDPYMGEQQNSLFH
ncbi:UNVERIFIED_CONTAM: hypothetical protein RMT77_017128 [Armadillidium vulgare]